MFGEIISCKVAYVFECVLTYHLILHLCQQCQPVDTTHINRAQVILLLHMTPDFVKSYNSNAQSFCLSDSHKTPRIRIQVTVSLFFFFVIVSPVC